MSTTDRRDASDRPRALDTSGPTADSQPRRADGDARPSSRPDARDGDEPAGGQVMASWAAALAAPMEAARAQADELARLRERGLHPDMDDTDGDGGPGAAPGSGERSASVDVDAPPTSTRDTGRR